MKQNGRLSNSYSVYPRHDFTVKRLAKEAGLTDSDIIRELIEVARRTEHRKEEPGTKWAQT